MRSIIVFLAALTAILSMPFSAMAQTPDPRPDTQTETSLSERDVELRAREVGKSLRCVVCQSQSIEDSNAPLAQDMRNLVRVRIKEGDTDAQVYEMMRLRYGDEILMKPPFQLNTYLLWLLPGALLIVSLLWYFLRPRRPRAAQIIAPLSDEEQQRLDALLSREEPRS